MPDRCSGERILDILEVGRGVIIQNIPQLDTYLATTTDARLSKLQAGDGSRDNKIIMACDMRELAKRRKAEAEGRKTI